MADRIDGYAKAIYELASAEGELARVEREFSLIARSVETSTDLRQALTDPSLPIDRKQGILERLIGGRAAPLTTHVVDLVVSQGRASEMAAVASRLAEHVARSAGKQVAEVRTAVELDDATISRLTTALSQATGRDVEVRTVVDPSVLGGVVARVGDGVVDGSVKKRLESLRSAVTR